MNYTVKQITNSVLQLKISSTNHKSKNRFEETNTRRPRSETVARFCVFRVHMCDVIFFNFSGQNIRLMNVCHQTRMSRSLGLSGKTVQRTARYHATTAPRVSQGTGYQESKQQSLVRRCRFERKASYCEYSFRTLSYYKFSLLES